VEELRLAGKTWRNEGEVLEVEPGRRLRWRTVEGADAHGLRAVEALGADRSLARLELVVQPHGAEVLMVPMLRRMLDRNLRGDLVRLRELVKARTATALAS
jgi:uncharacterized membrane protein